MGGGGGAKVDREAQSRQLQIEEERLALEKQAAEARVLESEKLAQQLEQQTQSNEVLAGLLGELNDQTITQNQQITSLLEQSTAVARRQTLGQEDELRRAATGAAQDRQRVLAGSQSNALSGSNLERPTSARFTDREKLSILSAVGI